MEEKGGVGVLLPTETEARLNELAMEIEIIRRQTVATVLAGACEIGKRLIEAKNRLPHGAWGSWLAAHVDYSERTAQNLMQLYEGYGKSDPQALADMQGLSITKAITLLGLDEERRSELIASGEAEELSTRELKKRVEELKALAEARQVRIDELEKESESRPDAEAEAEKLRAELAKAEKSQRQAAADSKRAAEKERARADQAESRAAELEIELEKLRSAEPEVREVVPKDVEAELDRLRRLEKSAPNETVIRMRSAYDRVLAEFRLITEALPALDAETAAKYRAAFARGLEQMAETIRR